VRGRRVFTEGDKEAGVWTAGQVVGLIDDVPTCEDLLARMEKVNELSPQPNHQEAEDIIVGMARKVKKGDSKL
jgi:Domain of unknown function (DUF1902)